MGCNASLLGQLTRVEQWQARGRRSVDAHHASCPWIFSPGAHLLPGRSVQLLTSPALGEVLIDQDSDYPPPLGGCILSFTPSSASAPFHAFLSLASCLRVPSPLSPFWSRDAHTQVLLSAQTCTEGPLGTTAVPGVGRPHTAAFPMGLRAEGPVDSRQTDCPPRALFRSHCCVSRPSPLPLPRNTRFHPSLQVLVTWGCGQQLWAGQGAGVWERGQCTSLKGFLGVSCLKGAADRGCDRSGYSVFKPPVGFNFPDLALGLLVLTSTSSLPLPVCCHVDLAAPAPGCFFFYLPGPQGLDVAVSPPCSVSLLPDLFLSSLNPTLEPLTDQTAALSAPSSGFSLWPRGMLPSFLAFELLAGSPLQPNAHQLQQPHHDPSSWRASQFLDLRRPLHLDLCPPSALHLGHPNTMMAP